MKLTKIQRVQIALGIVPNNLPFLYQDTVHNTARVYRNNGTWYYDASSSHTVISIHNLHARMTKQFFWCCKNAPHRVGGPGE